MNLLDKIWPQALILETSTVEDAVRNLDEVGIKIVLVVDKDKKLQGTISDGDIRRGLLNGLDFNSQIDTIINYDALVVPTTMPKDMVTQLMVANKIQQIPVIDEHKNILGLYLWDELTVVPKRDNLMVIMAGGKGTRLLPHTEDCPKPMLIVSGKPMLEHIIERAKREGFNHFVLAIHYLGNMIEDYFGNGDKLNIKIDYLREKSPLGTAGALSLFISRPEYPFVVTNGDVMTDIRYGEILDFHERQSASATMAVRLHELQNPFGVVQMEGLEIVGFEEKPIVRSYINAGVYVLSPEVLGELEKDKLCDMPTLFEFLQAKNMSTLAYPTHEEWLDVGRPDDLHAAEGNLDIDK